jgi:hypothetical protein
MPADPRPRRTAEWLGLAAILATATWLRAHGLSFGLPAVYNPDEISIMSRALGFATGDFNPHNFLYPTFFFYVLFAWIGGYFVLARLAGATASAQAFQTEFFVDPTNIYLAGRWLGVVCGILAVVAVWRLGTFLFGRATGVLAAAFLAVSPIAVRDAHYVKHDVPVTLAILVAFIAIVRIWPGPSGPTWPTAAAAPPSRASILLAGAACGVAFSTHYYSIFMILPLVWAIWIACRDRGPGLVVRGITEAGVAATAVFFLLSPFILVEPATAWRDIVANRQIVVDRTGAAEGALFANAGAYAVMWWREAVGWPLLVLGVAGLVALVGRSWPLAVLLLAFAIPFMLFISNTVAATRYLNPLIPLATLLAGYAVARAGGWARGPGKGRRPGAAADEVGATHGSSTHGAPHTPSARFRGWGAAGLAALAMLPGAHLSWQTGRFFSQTDTRTLAQQFIEAHVPPGATVLVQPYSVQLQQSREGLEEALTFTIGDPARASTKFALRLALDPYPAPAYRTLFLGDGGLDADKIYIGYALFAGGSAEALRQYGVDYVVLKQYNLPDPGTEPVLQALERTGRRIARFTPYRPDVEPTTRQRVAPFLHNTATPLDAALARPGPVMEVWELRATR